MNVFLEMDEKIEPECWLDGVMQALWPEPDTAESWASTEVQVGGSALTWEMINDIVRKYYSSFIEEELTRPSPLTARWESISAPNVSTITVRFDNNE